MTWNPVSPRRTSAPAQGPPPPRSTPPRWAAALTGAAWGAVVGAGRRRRRVRVRRAAADEESDHEDEADAGDAGEQPVVGSAAGHAPDPGRTWAEAVVAPARTAAAATARERFSLVDRGTCSRATARLWRPSGRGRGSRSRFDGGVDVRVGRPRKRVPVGGLGGCGGRRGARRAEAARGAPRPRSAPPHQTRRQRRGRIVQRLDRRRSTQLRWKRRGGQPRREAGAPLTMWAESSSASPRRASARRTLTASWMRAHSAAGPEAATTRVGGPRTPASRGRRRRGRPRRLRRCCGELGRGSDGVRRREWIPGVDIHRRCSVRRRRELRLPAVSRGGTAEPPLLGAIPTRDGCRVGGGRARRDDAACGARRGDGDVVDPVPRGRDGADTLERQLGLEVAGMAGASGRRGVQGRAGLLVPPCQGRCSSTGATCGGDIAGGRSANGSTAMPTCSSMSCADAGSTLTRASWPMRDFSSRSVAAPALHRVQPTRCASTSAVRCGASSPSMNVLSVSRLHFTGRSRCRWSRSRVARAARRRPAASGEHSSARDISR